MSRVERLCTLPDDAYIEAHMLNSDYAAEILAERKIKMIIIMRDHRAVALSHADWILESPQNRFYPMMMSLSLRERLAYEYNGTPGNWAEVKTPLIPIIARYRTMLPWRHYPHVHVTTFESLVGAKGGGSPGSQLREVERIFKFLNRDEQALDAVREGLWGNSSTFRNGQAWRWRQYVDDFPTAAFEQGPELAEIVDYMSAPDL